MERLPCLHVYVRRRCGGMSAEEQETIVGIEILGEKHKSP